MNLPILTHSLLDTTTSGDKAAKWTIVANATDKWITSDVFVIK
jgi:hypothetical protein